VIGVWAVIGVGQWWEGGEEKGAGGGKGAGENGGVGREINFFGEERRGGKCHPNGCGPCK
jgi:hypothetical protein